MNKLSFCFSVAFTLIGSVLVAQGNQKDSILIKSEKALNPDQGSGLQFRNVGPSRGGRVTAVAGVAQQPNVFYMGATGGGLWKSTDYGSHWNNISDGWFTTPSIGAIAVAKADPNIIFVGTGSDGIRSNVIPGKGIYKSSDAGMTWEFSGIREAGQIGAVEIHPDNPDIVFAAATGQPFRKSKERGVYRTMDGGRTWDQVLFLSDSVGAVDLEFAPDNPDILYAAMWRGERKPWTIISGGAEDGIFKSTDGGNTWNRKTKGLPTGLIGKVDFAVSADKPERVWALVQASDEQGGLYRSDDYAETWIKVQMPPKTHSSITYRPFYFTNLSANPKNADNIWSGTKQFWTSFDGGENWRQVATTHSDHHDLWINPMDTTIMIEGNDGGASVTRDGGINWSTVFNQPTAELYNCYVDDQYPYYLYSGQQDNSTIRVPGNQPFLNVLGNNDSHGMDDLIYWENMGGCETGPVIPKPGNPDIIYSNCKGQFSVYNRKLGVEHLYYIGVEDLYGNHPDEITYRFQRVTPMEVSPHDSNTVYYGSQYLHKTTNGGQSWEIISPDLTANKKEYSMRSGGPIDEDISGEEYYAVLYAIKESPVQKGVIWTGSNDGLFYVTRDGGLHWNNVTPDMPEGGRVSNIEASHHNPGKAYYAVSRSYLGDDTPYLYKTTDFGKTWSKLSNGNNGIPPDYPARVVREDPVREGLLFAGTEFGIFVSFDDGRNWKTFQRNLPITPVTDIRLIRNDLALSTMGRSFWIMDDYSPLQEFDPGAPPSLKLFKPGDNTGDKQNVYFTLPDSIVETGVTIEFYRDGKIIFSKRMNISNLGRDEWGIYKYVWDQHYYFADGNNEFRGPMVAPGQYNVRLWYAGRYLEQSYTYKINPELEAFGTCLADLLEQEELSLKVTRLYLDINQTISDIRKEMGDTKNKKVAALLAEKLQQLETGPKRYDKPMLKDNAIYLFEMISHTPQKLGRDAFERYEILRSQFEQLKSK